MLRNHGAMQAIRDIMSKKPAVAAPAVAAPVVAPAVENQDVLDAAAQAAVLDDANAAAAAELQAQEDEDVLDSAGEYASTDLALKAVSAIQEWAETVSADLDEGEGLGDRLFALLAGIVDEDLDGELSEEEADLLNIAAEQAVDYLVEKGVPEEDAITLLTDFDNELSDSVQELVIAKLPEGDEAAAADIDAFVFGDGSDEAVMDAVYKKRVVVRQGKKVRINKRVSGKVRLSAAQKIAVRKMLRKSHSAKAQLRRAKSMKVRVRSGI